MYTLRMIGFRLRKHSSYYLAPGIGDRCPVQLLYEIILADELLQSIWDSQNAPTQLAAGRFIDFSQYPSVTTE